MTFYVILLALHALSVMFWVGSLVSITRVMSSGLGEPEAVRHRLAAAARKIYRSVSSVWMGTALLSAIGMIALMKGEHFKHGWFHGKLAAALVMLALHFVLGARVRGAEAQGLNDDTARSMRGLQVGVLVVAALAVAFVIVIKALRH